MRFIAATPSLIGFTNASLRAPPKDGDGASSLLSSGTALRLLIKATHTLKFKIAAYDGLGRNQEAIDSFKVYKEWTDQQFNAETRKLAEMSALELEAARAGNEAETLRLYQQRMMLLAIVSGLLLIAVFLAIYLRRRLLQMKALKQAYDQLEEGSRR